MKRHTFLALLSTAAFPLMLSLPPGDLHAQQSPATKQQLLEQLNQDMVRETGWVSIHGGDALIEHGDPTAVRAWLDLALTKDPDPLPRVGRGRLGVGIAKTPEEKASLLQSLEKIAMDDTVSDRITAVETLAKLRAAPSPALQTSLKTWLTVAPAVDHPFIHWLLCYDPATASQHAEALVQALQSQDPQARLRASYALGRLPTVTPQALKALTETALKEAADSPAKIYLACAALRQGADPAPLLPTLEHTLKHGAAGEKLEAATSLGLRRIEAALTLLPPILQDKEADPRIGAASGLLYFHR